MSFALDLSKACDKAKGQTELLARRIMLELFYKVIYKSPVGNPDYWKSVQEWEARKAAGTTKAKSPAYGYVGGRFRANWNAGVGAIDKTTTESTSDSVAKAKVTATVESFTFDGKSIFLTNSLPYSLRLEHGHSKQQAPAGMVRLSLVEITNQYGA